MAGVKHTLDESPFMTMFDGFRKELDEHHDRRERVIKASRDITALSKKIIFALQRTPNLRRPLTDISPLQSQIATLFSGIAPDLQDTNAYRYQRQISPGIQEYVEALSFQHYLESQTLLTLEQARSRIPGVLLTQEDYLLGLFDMVGELMRFAITGMATRGALPGTENAVLTDMRALRMGFESLDLHGSGARREVDKKIEVMQTCVEKVEKSVYGLQIRGRERPKGWVPDLTSDEAIESY